MNPNLATRGDGNGAASISDVTTSQACCVVLPTVSFRSCTTGLPVTSNATSMFSPRSMSTPTGDDNTLIRPPVADFVGDKGSNSRPATFIKPRSRIEPVRGELSKYVARLSSGRTLITPSTNSARYVRCTLLNSARTISSGIRSCFPSASSCHCGRKSPLRGRSASRSSKPAGTPVWESS